MGTVFRNQRASELAPATAGERKVVHHLSHTSSVPVAAGGVWRGVAGVTGVAAGGVWRGLMAGGLHSRLRRSISTSLEKSAWSRHRKTHCAP
jgi:hypothetical protein